MKKKIKIFLVLILLIIPINISAKEEQVEMTSFGGSHQDYFEGTTQTSDGGFIAVGFSGSTDLDGLENYGNNDAIIVKFDKDNNIEWKTKYGGSKGDRFYKVIETENKEYIAVGYGDSNIGETVVNKGNNDGIIVKFDKDGKVVWQKNYGGNNDDRFFGIDTTTDGCFVVTGRVHADSIDGITNYGNGDAIILKFDKDGNQLWAKTYGGNKFDNFNEVATTDNGEYIAVGYTGSTDINGLENYGNNDAVIVKFDKDGNVIWHKKWGGAKGDFFYKAEHTQDDGVIVVGYSDSTIGESIVNKGNNDAIIVKFDKDGNVLWQKNYGGTNADYFETVAQLKNGSYIAVGHTVSTDITDTTNNGGIDILIVNFDKNGNMENHKKIGGSSDDYLKSVAATGDGGYVAVGHTNSTNFNDIKNNGYNDGIVIHSKINYIIVPKDTTNGTFDYSTDTNNKTKIILNPKTGYELEKIIIKNSEGEEIDYYEENGNYYFDLSDDVSIEVIYKEIINPSTGVESYHLIFTLLLLISLSTVLLLKNKKYL